MQVAAAARSLGSEQALFQADEGDGGRSAHRLAEDSAGIGMQTRGQIQRQNGHLLRIDELDGLATGTIDFAFQAGAEQGIDNQFGIGQGCDAERPDRYASGTGIPGGAQGIAAQALDPGQGQHLRIQPRLPGQSRHHIAITAIVAAAAKYDDAPRVRPALAQQRKRSRTGPAHQHRAGNAALFNGNAVQLPHLGGAVQFKGQFAHGASPRSR